MHKRPPPLRLPWEKKPIAARQALTNRWGLVVALLCMMGIAPLIVAKIRSNSAMRKTRATISATYHAVAAFRHHLGRCPTKLDELARPPGTRAKYIHRRPVDAWGNEFLFECISNSALDSRIVSSGPSGSFLIDDNIY